MCIGMGGDCSGNRDFDVTLVLKPKVKAYCWRDFRRHCLYSDEKALTCAKARDFCKEIAMVPSIRKRLTKAGKLSIQQIKALSDKCNICGGWFQPYNPKPGTYAPEDAPFIGKIGCRNCGAEAEMLPNSSR